MIDLHTHSLLSDGALLPSELVRRYKAAGYKAVAITDHVDISNIDIVVPQIALACGELNKAAGIKVIPGAELTHIPPVQISAMVKRARRLGAKIVLVHGETIAEPVAPGTNNAALRCGIDILAHPGLISKEDAALAAGKGICLEITARKGHAFTNGHVAKIAAETGAKLLLNSDSHSPEDIIFPEQAEKIALGCGLSAKELKALKKNAEKLL